MTGTSVGLTTTQAATNLPTASNDAFSPPTRSAPWLLTVIGGPHWPPLPGGSAKKRAA